MGPAEWLLLILLSMLWGSSFFFAAVSLRELPPFHVVLARLLLAAVMLHLILFFSGHRLPRSLSAWLPYIVMGTINNAIPFSLLVWGQSHIASGLASILNAVAPIFAMLMGHFVSSEEGLSARRLAGALLGLIGVAALIGFDALNQLGTATLAELACLGAALFYAAAGLFGRRFRGQPPIVVATCQVSASSLIMLPIAFGTTPPSALAMPSLEVWGALLGASLFSTSLGYLIYFRILSRAGATNILLVTFLIPISAILLGTAVLHETLQAAHLGGLTGIFLGLALIDGRAALLLARLFRPSADTSKAARAGQNRPDDR
jgi:drug/metabolite transporter (DMT)-like permease